MTTDRSMLKSMAQSYFDGFYQGDADRLSTIFHPSATLTQVIDGAVKSTPCEAWLRALRSRPSPASLGSQRHDQIVMIDECGPTLALLKVTCAVPPRYFTDLLSCIKIDGKWLIAQKVFMTETK
jgi:hypothetical protein